MVYLSTLQKLMGTELPSQMMMRHAQAFIMYMGSHSATTAGNQMPARRIFLQRSAHDMSKDNSMMTIAVTPMNKNMLRYFAGIIQRCFQMVYEEGDAGLHPTF